MTKINKGYVRSKNKCATHPILQVRFLEGIISKYRFNWVVSNEDILLCLPNKHVGFQTVPIYEQ